MRVTVDVMHMLPRLQFSSQVLFHDMPMDAHLSSVYSHGLVSVLRLIGWLKPKVRKLFKMNFCKARPGAIFRGFFSVRRNAEIYAADGALQNSTCSVTFFHAIAPHVAIAYYTPAKSKK